jgi:hypothetical protein
MLAELQNSIGNDVLLGLAQAAGAIALCVAVVALCGWQSVHIEREAAVSMARGLLQMVLVGIVLALLLHGSLLVGSVILFMMTIAAAVTASRRLKGMDGALLLCFWSIAAGAGSIIAVMLATRSLRGDISILVPVGSMIIANGDRALPGRNCRPCRSHRSRPVARGRAHRHCRAVSSERSLCKPLAPPRYDEIPWIGLDPGRHGRHGGFGHKSGLRGHLPVHRRCHDPGCLRYHGSCCDPSRALARVLPGGAADPSTDGSRGLKPRARSGELTAKHWREALDFRPFLKFQKFMEPLSSI